MAPAPAHARAVYAAPPAPEPTQRRTFWERVKSPHIEEITALVRDATYLRFNVTQNYYEPHMWPVRRDVLRDAAARYLRAWELDPAGTDYLLEGAHTTFEAADWPEAARLYALYLEKAPGQNEAVVRFNLGESLLRTGRAADAIEVLEDGLGTGLSGFDRARFLTLLGYAYMNERRLDDAADACERADELYAQQYGAGGIDFVAVAMLAVIYDRDEQTERSHEMVDALRAQDPSFSFLFANYPMLGGAMPSQRYYLPFSPASDKHYFLALFYEAQGRYPEAAASWRAYLGSADPAWAERAKDHLRQVEDQQKKSLDEAKKKRKAQAAQQQKKPPLPPKKPRPNP
jgi:tetratricopeptide (TPR) repeat protein